MGVTFPLASRLCDKRQADNWLLDKGYQGNQENPIRHGKLPGQVDFDNGYQNRSLIAGRPGIDISKP